MAESISARVAWKLKKAIVGRPAKGTSNTGTASFVRTDDNGVSWVRLPGANVDTPVNSNLVADMQSGDTVSYRIDGGRLSVTGNATSPSVGGTYVASTVAPVAEKADKAISDALRAHDAAELAENSAVRAQASATSASEYASRALGNLSTVQSVAETLAWITAHGTMTPTTDTAPDPTHVYFVADSSGDYSVGGSTYSVVTEPDASDMATYYELSVDESLNNYVGTHLAVTDEGLWVIPVASGGYKVLIATGSGTTYTTAGTHIIDSEGNTVAVFSDEMSTIGRESEGRAVVTQGGFNLIDKHGTSYFSAEGMAGTKVVSLYECMLTTPATAQSATRKGFSWRNATGTGISDLDKYGADDIVSYDLYNSGELIASNPDELSATFSGTFASGSIQFTLRLGDLQPSTTYTVRVMVRVYDEELTNPVMRVGAEGQSHQIIDYHSMRMVDSDGNQYFEVRDIRGYDGEAHYTEDFTGDGATTDYAFTYEATRASSVKATLIDKQTGTETDLVSGIDYTPTTTQISLTVAPESYQVVFVSYDTQALTGKAYTFGMRDDSADVGFMSVAEGYDTKASGDYSHVGGVGSDASGNASVAMGNHTSASGENSVAYGFGTESASREQVAIGRFNEVDDSGTYPFVIGNGNVLARSNAFAVDWSGNVVAAGTMSAAKQTGTMTLNTTNCTLNTDYNRAWSNGVVATVQLGIFTLNSALSNGGSVAVGTVPDGYRPAGRIYANVGCALAGVTGLLVAYIGTDGTVTLVNRSGASLSTSVGIIVTATYAI